MDGEWLGAGGDGDGLLYEVAAVAGAMACAGIDHEATIALAIESEDSIGSAAGRAATRNY